MAPSPETRYARTSDGLHIAYQVTGSGPLALLDVTDGTVFSIDSSDEQPRWQDYLNQLASFSQLIRLDLRGIGLSDPLGQSDPPTVEQWVTDLLAVLDAEHIAEVAVLGAGFGGLAALLLVSTHPERARALVLVNAYACLRRKADYPIGVPDAVLDGFGPALVDPAEPAGDDLPLMAPSLLADAGFAAWWRRVGHRGASPATALAMWKTALSDLRPSLAAIQVPTLVLHARENRFVRVEHGRYLAEHISGARFVEFPVADHVPWAMGPAVPSEIEEFLTGARQAAPTDRLLATVLFTDIVGSTALAAAIGDRAWKERLDQFDTATERQLTRYAGRMVKSIGDGTLAIFDGPARAISCAVALRDAMRQLGLELRAGLHAGEIELRGADVSGIAVNLAQRVCALAEPGEIQVSRTVVDLVAGSGIEFDDRGEHELKGVPGAWRLFAVTT